ncbi:uncharacterized protein LOC142344633 [Convolutriloba macropyga]|uniref:uncharacterized protein LOC142344633 n=1 Tax=Convolutriloba macropyga TaxID=536237 RepID=UPI003F51EFF1
MTSLTLMANAGPSCTAKISLTIALPFLFILITIPTGVTSLDEARKVCNNNLECKQHAEREGNSEQFCCDTLCSDQDCADSTNVVGIVLGAIAATVVLSAIIICITCFKCKKEGFKIEDSFGRLMPPSYSRSATRPPSYDVTAATSSSATTSARPYQAHLFHSGSSSSTTGRNANGQGSGVIQVASSTQSSRRGNDRAPPPPSYEESMRQNRAS